MSDLAVVTIQQKIPLSWETYYFPEQCYRSIARFRVYPICLGRGEEWGGHGHKAKYLKRALDNRRILNKYMIFTDSFDALFVVHPDEILETYLAMPDRKPIVWGAEKYCFSDASLAPDLERVAPSATSYRYLNSGWAIGETEAFHKALGEMDPEITIKDDYLKEDGTWHNDNDQVHWQLQQIRGSVPIGLDTEARMVWNMAGIEDSEIDITGEKVKCVETGTYPQVLHLNGGSKNIWKDRLIEKLKLP